jgi:hypothetical protein
MSKFKDGDRVMFMSSSLHLECPEYYPTPYTVGTHLFSGWVQWPAGSTSGNDRWDAPDDALVLASSISTGDTVRLLNPTVTGVQTRKNGTRVIQLANGVCIDECRLERVEPLIGYVSDAKASAPKYSQTFTEPEAPYPDAAPVFDWEAFKAGKIAVHCDTEKKATEFLKECEDRGINWCGSSKSTHWRVYKEKTCYDMSGQCGTYADVDFYNSHGYTIISYPFYREVKRPAKPGEWFKIVNSSDCSHDEYKNDDILQAVEPPYDSNDGRAYYKREVFKYAALEEYCTLENYTPPATAPRIIVSRRMLEELDACMEGMDDFNKRFPSGEVEWNELIADHERRGEDCGSASNNRKAWLIQHKGRIEAMQGWRPPAPRGVSPIAVLIATDDGGGTSNPLKRGNIYFIDSGGHFHFDNCISSAIYKSFEHFKAGNPGYGNCLEPYVGETHG